jgi:hypothetical protein
VPAWEGHHCFGEVAAVWAVLGRLGVAAIIDDVVAGVDPVKGVSVGRFVVAAALNQVTVEHLPQISVRIVAEYDLDTSSVVLDMANFATWVDSTNEAAPLLAWGQSKQKRSDLRLVQSRAGRHQ